MKSTILSVITYGAQNSSLNSNQERRIQVEQRSMERCMLNIRITDHVTNQDLMTRSGIKDALEKAKELKWQTQRRNDLKLTKLTENWIQNDGTRKRLKQEKRSEDEIENHWQIGEKKQIIDQPGKKRKSHLSKIG